MRRFITSQVDFHPAVPLAAILFHAAFKSPSSPFVSHLLALLAKELKEKITQISTTQREELLDKRKV